MNSRLNRVAIFLALILVAAAMSLFTVDQRQYALVLQFGEVKWVIKEAGLNYKIPFVQSVRYFDKRIITLDNNDPERFITSEKKNVLVDSFIKWKIIDPTLYYISVGGDEARARTRLNQTVNAGLREEFGKRTVHDVISGERDQIMEQMRVKADFDARRIGVEIVDVRLKRVELPTEVSDNVYSRMKSERKRVANQLRAEGAAEAEKIRADADRQREVILADAYREAQKVKGEGDSKATAIYGAAFGQNPEFYAFYKSLEAYRSSFSSKGDMLVVDPGSDFFKYMRGRGGDKAK
ncbi:MAG: protease modulator HflC [Azonexus sp.]|jgi:membrane protease subunit HflC|nr:protease modulator HflC [Azonexus sp.]